MRRLNEDNKSNKRKSLFRTRCKCQNKVCKVIIGRGSTDNLVSEEMVKNLQLERKRHLHLYRIAWLQDDRKV